MAMTTINDRSSGKSSGGDQWRRWCWRCFTTVTLEFYDRALSRKLVSCVTGVAKKIKLYHFVRKYVQNADKKDV